MPEIAPDKGFLARLKSYRDGQLERLTTDQTLVQRLVDGGALTHEAARTHPRRHMVTNVIGGPRAGVHAEIHRVGLVDGDVLLLGSDGMTGPVPDAEIARFLAAHPDPDEACRRPLEAALNRGGPDNVTVVVAR